MGQAGPITPDSPLSFFAALPDLTTGESPWTNLDGDAPGNEVWTSEDLDLLEVWPLEGQPAHASVAEQAARAMQPLLVRMEPLAQDYLASWLRSLVGLRRAPLSPTEKCGLRSGRN